jgi:hypothetical protein
MKFLKKFEAMRSGIRRLNEYFSEDEVLEIKDLYNDLVDDLDLHSVEHERELNKSMCSLFQVNQQFSLGSKLTSKVFSIHIVIRTLDSNDWNSEDHFSYAALNKQGKQKYDLVSNELNEFIKTLKSFGYDCEKSDIDMKLDSWKFITGGIKLIIMK